MSSKRKEVKVASKEGRKRKVKATNNASADRRMGIENLDVPPKKEKGMGLVLG